METTSKQETVTVVGGLPLRLCFSPTAIREHFTSGECDSLTDAQLAHVGYLALQSDVLYAAFHETIRAAVQEVAGFDPDAV
jgi:hypothetical protein